MFLDLLDYHITVKSTLYAKYYFELRALFKNSDEFPLTPMDEVTGVALEARSKEASYLAKQDPLSFTTNVP